MFSSFSLEYFGATRGGASPATDLCRVKLLQMLPATFLVLFLGHSLVHFGDSATILRNLFTFLTGLVTSLQLETSFETFGRLCNRSFRTILAFKFGSKKVKNSKAAFAEGCKESLRHKARLRRKILIYVAVALQPPTSPEQAMSSRRDFGTVPLTA